MFSRGKPAHLAKIKEGAMATTISAPVEISSEEIQSALHEFVTSDRVLVRPIELIAWASDASFYRMIPKAVVQARSLEEIRALFAFSQQTRIPMTFRAAGTSLSGQAISDGLLVEVARNWRELRVEQGGRQIRLQPGVLGARANQALAAYGAKIGPDPGRLPLAPSAAFCPTTPAACAAASSRTPTTPSSR
jgi:D-lactate dehydrogenase